jgi:hypothetical protein
VVLVDMLCMLMFSMLCMLMLSVLCMLMLSVLCLQSGVKRGRPPAASSGAAGSSGGNGPDSSSGESRAPTLSPSCLAKLCGAIYSGSLMNAMGKVRTICTAKQ